MAESTIRNIRNIESQQVTQFKEQVVAQKSGLIELKSIYGISALRDVTETTGSATVTNANGEYTLSNTANGTDSAMLESAERGRYISGLTAEAGIGFRTADTPTGNQVIYWGYFDENNGFGFGYDATGIFIFDRTGGTETKVYQSSWNTNTLESGDFVLDLADGHIFEIDFSWYGYGTISFNILTFNATTRESEVTTVHRLRKEAVVSVQDPNLPVRVAIDNDGTAETLSAVVTGRQFSVLGKYVPNRRINSERRLSLGSIGTTLVPLISFRRKSAFRSVSVKLESFDIIADADLVYEIRLAPTLTGASFGTPTNTTASESACESDNSATAITGGSGELLDSGLLEGTNKNVKGFVNLLDLDVPNTHIITLAVRTITGSNATASAVLRWREEW